MTISNDMLAAFIQVAERSSVSAAANALGVGKSVVSKRVAQLEAAMQTTLFSRSTRKVALTPAGEAYLEFARRALGEISSGQEQLRLMRSELTGQIRLTAPVSWGQQVLAKRLPEFLRQHPGIEIELGLGDRVVDLAYERVDIGLRWSAQPTPQMVNTPVARVAWVMAASAAYLAACSAPATPEDLALHSCMCYWRESSDDSWTLNAGTRSVKVQVCSRYHANNPEAVADAALAGLGVALLPRYLCEDALADGRLTSVLEGWVPATKFGTHITAVATPDRMGMARNQALLAFLRQQLGPV